MERERPKNKNGSKNGVESGFSLFLQFFVFFFCFCKRPFYKNGALFFFFFGMFPRFLVLQDAVVDTNIQVLQIKFHHVKIPKIKNKNKNRKNQTQDKIK